MQARHTHRSLGGKNSDYFAELLFGAAKARCVLTGVNWRLAAPEIAYILKDAGVTTLFLDGRILPPSLKA